MSVEAPPQPAPYLSAAILAPPSWRQRYPGLARFLRSYVAVAALFLIILIILGATFGPYLWKVDPAAQDDDLYGEPMPPSWKYPAGTDYLGRDMLARLIAGARISLAVGFVSMFINLVIGVGLGTIAGWKRGWIDTVLMRLVDATYSIPILLIVIMLQVFVKPFIELVTDKLFSGDSEIPLLLSPDLLSIYLALGLANWLTMARLSRAEVMNQSSRDYVSACKALGVSGTRTLLRHVLPNCIGPLIVAATLAIPEAIFFEAFLAFIGLGVSAPQASWGTLAEEGRKLMSNAPHTLLYPALAISVTMLAFNLLGDGLRDAFDPKGRH